MVKDSVSRVKKFQAEAQALLDEQGMVLVDEARLHPLRRFIHFWVLVGKSFVRNRCPVRASALAMDARSPNRSRNCCRFSRRQPNNAGSSSSRSWRTN